MAELNIFQTKKRALCALFFVLVRRTQKMSNQFVTLNL
jgi:hypothetical protein